MCDDDSLHFGRTFEYVEANRTLALVEAHHFRGSFVGLFDHCRGFIETKSTAFSNVECVYVAVGAAAHLSQLAPSHEI